MRALAVTRVIQQMPASGPQTTMPKLFRNGVPSLTMATTFYEWSV